MDIKTFMCDIPIYIINLKDSIERRNNVENEFSNYNYNIKFIEAIDGRNSVEFKNKYNVEYTSYSNYSDATIAVICSHVKAIKLAYDNNLSKVCIFEDDVHIDLINKCNFTMNDICNLNNNWEAIQLFYTSGDISILDRHHNNFIENGLKLLPREYFHSGTCYIINRKGMENILNNIVIVDDSMTKFIIKHKIFDPENTILAHINSYIINRQVFYYYFSTMTYDCYLNDINNDKINCQRIHLITKQKLLEFYS